MIDLRKNKDAAKLPRNSWESVRNGTSDLSKIWYTTKRVSSDYVGKVYYRHPFWCISIFKPATGESWTANACKQLGRAKNMCIRAMSSLYNNE